MKHDNLKDRYFGGIVKRGDEVGSSSSGGDRDALHSTSGSEDIEMDNLGDSHRDKGKGLYLTRYSYYSHSILFLC